MSWYMIVAAFMIILSAINLTYQVYKMTELDARSRGLKHSKFWGIFSISGQGCQGLILYLLGRRKYVSNMSLEEKNEIEARKKKIGAILAFFTIAIIILIIGGVV